MDGESIMQVVRSNQHSFNGGEVTPEFFGQIGDAKYQSGLAICRNFVAKPQGPVENRAGFAFVRELKSSLNKARLVSFTFSTTQTMIIEMGGGYFRFHTQGASVLVGSPPAWSNATAYVVGSLVSSGGNNYYCIAPNTNQVPPNATYWYLEPSNGVYEIPNPFATADLFDIHYVQSADVLTITHPNYPPTELRRLGATMWTLVPISFIPTILAPTGVSATPDAVRTGYDYHYVVTAMASDNVSQSVASADATCVNNIFTSGAKNTITWSAVVGAVAYTVYKRVGGSYGYIGRTTTLSIVDDNIAADLSRTPPIYDTVFQAAGDYPGAVSYFEQRRCFAGTINQPQTIWMTNSGTESGMAYTLPVRDDNRIAFKVAARESNTIRHIVPLTSLLLLTSSAEWRVTSINSDAITPSTVSVRPQSYIGASNVQPVIINNNMLYGAARGGHLREMAYSWQANGYASGDLSLRAPHLFDGFEMVDMCYAKAPIPIVWAVSTSGGLLGITYVPEQQVGSWHHHDTDGLFESCAVVAEGNEDVLYVIVNRTIGGVTKRYIERQATRKFATPADAFFVDCGATYNGAPVTTVSGLTWLEGKTVNILADGAVCPQKVVTAGSITIDNPASKIQVGLPIIADAQTLPLATQIDAGFGQGRVKNVNKVWLRVVNSSGIFAGPSLDKLIQYKQRTTEPYGSPPSLKTQEIEIDVEPTWGDGAQIIVRQSDPLPITLVSMSMEVAIGN